ncbi:hypothetical protein LY76DRAFT_527770, partial [Colletotrichum caudatum]
TSSEIPQSNNSIGMHSPVSVMPMPTIVVLHCLSCRKEVELTSTDDPKDAGMIWIGYNMYYCSNCDKLTGYTEECGSRSTSA